MLAPNSNEFLVTSSYLILVILLFGMTNVNAQKKTLRLTESRSSGLYLNSTDTISNFIRYNPGSTHNEKIVIQGGTKVIGSFFNCNSDFTNISFTNSVAFNNVDFREAVFGGSAFHGFATFKDCEFKGDASFSTAWFEDLVDFSQVAFDSTVSFFNAFFQNNVKFRNLKLSSNSRFVFINTRLPDTIDFSFNPEIPNTIDLTYANFEDYSRIDRRNNYNRHAILFYKSDISKFRLDYIHYQLALPDSILEPYFSDQYSSFRKIRILNDEKEAIYEALLSNFNSHGQKESYKLLDLEYQHFRLYQHWYLIPLYWINRFWWNFGYDKESIFIWTFLFIFFFSAVNYFLLRFLNENIYRLENIPVTDSTITVRKRIWYSFVYTSIIFFRLTLKVEKINFKRAVGSSYLIFLYTLGLVCLAYIANYVLQK